MAELDCKTLSEKVKLISDKKDQLLFDLENKNVENAVKLKNEIVEILVWLTPYISEAVKNPEHTQEIYLRSELFTLKKFLSDNGCTGTTDKLWDSPNINFSGTKQETLWDTDRWNSYGVYFDQNKIPPKETGANTAITLVHAFNLGINNVAVLSEVKHLKILNIYNSVIAKDLTSARMERLENLNLTNCIVSNFDFLLQIDMPKMFHLNLTRTKRAPGVDPDAWKANRQKVISQLQDRNVYVLVTE